MGFNKVYKCLMEMFPQIDTRLLKAVAIEHSKDADAAANSVLNEILPYFSKQSLPADQSASSSTPVNQSPTGHSDGDERAEPEERSTLRRRITARRKNITPSSSMEPGSITSGSATNTDLADAHNSDSTYLSKALNDSTGSHFYDSQLFCNNESEEVILLGRTQESGVELGSNKVSTAMPNALINGEGGNADLGQVCSESNKSVPLDKGQGINVKVDTEHTPFSISTLNDIANGSLTDWKDFDGPGVTAAGTSCCGISHQLESSLDCPLVKFESSVAQMGMSSVQEHTPDVPECVVESDISSVTSNPDCGEMDSSDLLSKQENTMSEKGDIADDSFVTRSGQMCRVDFLEDMIEDAKSNKKTLFTAMESVMNLIREVEIQEKAAEEAKAEAERGGLDILVKVEELKQMLAHVREANGMHAGEIHGEKAILATEARELQNRLLSLSEERDKSLALLDEMRETLEARLAAAQEMRKVAEQEKLEKEESAQNSLAEQEAIMEKVVQESKILQNQAEENSKLREFLMDRGHVVDSLQGEISVICQDVRLLKEKFDERVPLSKSVSSSQTTCILASSSSSVKSMVSSLLAEQGMPAGTPKKMSPTPSVDAQSPKSRLEDGRIADDWKELCDDGWDIFEKEETELNCKGL